MPDTRRLGATLAPNGAIATPAYAFTNDPDTGLFLNAVGDLRAAVGGIEKLRMTDDGTNGSGYLMGRGIGAIGFQYGGANVFIYYLGVVTSTVPLRAPNGLVTAPAYSFTNDIDAGLFLNAVGDMRLAIGGASPVVMADDGTNGSVYVTGRGTGDIRFQHGGVNKMFVLANRVSIGGVPLSFAEMAAPATPPASEVYVYAKTDRKVYSKDSTGLETALGGGSAADTDDIEFLATWGAF